MGAYTADILLYIFGVGSFFFVAVVFLLGGFMLVGQRPELKPSEFVGYGLFVFAGAVLSHLIFAGELVLGHSAGGLVGDLLGKMFVGLIGTVGTYILSVCIGLLALMLVTDMSLGNILRWIGRQIGGVFRSMIVRYKAEREFRRQVREAQANIEPESWAIDDDEVSALARARMERFLSKQAVRDEARAERSSSRSSGKASKKKKTSSRKSLPKVVAPERDIPVKSEDPPVKATPDSPPPVALDIPIDDPNEPKLDWGALERDLDNAEVTAPKPSASDLPAATAATADDAAKTSRRSGARKSRKDPAAIGPQIVESEEHRSARELRKNLDKAPTKLAKLGHGDFELPPLSFLDIDDRVEFEVDHEKLRLMAMQLEKTLGEFGVEGKVVEICPGPVITMFEFSPAPGVKISKIANLSDDLAMALAAMSVRIIAPIPGKGVVGIEVPNDTRETVYLKEIIAHDKFQNARARMPIALGKNTAGGPVHADLAKMPHLLVAGATGSGKSVAVNTMIVSLLFRFSPEDVRLILVDPKMLEFSIYADIPHLLLPVVTDPKKAAIALNWAVEEMENRYQLLADLGVRNIQSYNKRVAALTKEVEADLAAGRTDSEAVQRMELDSDGVPKFTKLPYIVCIIDEFADLMMVASKDVETCVARLAQKARAAGIHLILATQRPSVDVITGLIKANFPTRIALRVAQRTDSRTILDSNGAEHLLGRGDMLFLPPGTSQQQRVHGAYVSETEIDRIVDFLKSQGQPQYDESILTFGDSSDGDGDGESSEDRDEHYDRAIEIVTTERQASISMLQRKLRIGYNRAARIVDHMEEDGIVGPSDGSKPRDVLIPAPPSL